MKVHLLVVVDGHADVVTGEKVFALGAEAHLAERPPSFQRVVVLKELQLAAGCLGERLHEKWMTNNTLDWRERPIFGP